jgi:uncharacterized protein YbaR (Trm112 family)
LGICAIWNQLDLEIVLARSTEKCGMTGNGSQDGMVFYRKLSQWYTTKDDIPKLIAD